MKLSARSDPQRRIRGLHELVRFVGPSLALRPVFTLAVSVLIARTLGPEGRGDYAVAVNMLAALPIVCQMGLQLATRYWSARGEVDSRSLLRTITAIAFVLGLVTSAIGITCIMRRSPTWLVPDSLGLAGAAALGLSLFLSLLNGFWSNYLNGQERYGYATWGTILGLVVQVLVLVAWWQFDGISLDAALIALAAQLVFSFLLFFVLNGGDFAKALRAPYLSVDALRQMLRFGRWEWMGQLLVQTNLRLNIFLLAALSGSGEISRYETGLYGAVLGPANFLLLLAAPLNLVISARTARRSGDSSFAHRVAGALRVIFLLGAASALAVSAIAPTAVPWVFGERFANATLPLRLLLPGIVSLCLVQTIGQYFSGARRPDWNTKISATGAGLTVGLGVLLIPQHGASGAAAATTFANTTMLLLSVYAFLRVSGLRLRDLMVFRRDDWTPLWRVLLPPWLHRDRS